MSNAQTAHRANPIPPPTKHQLAFVLRDGGGVVAGAAVPWSRNLSGGPEPSWDGPVSQVRSGALVGPGFPVCDEWTMPVAERRVGAGSPQQEGLS